MKYNSEGNIQEYKEPRTEVKGICRRTIQEIRSLLTRSRAKTKGIPTEK